MWPFRSKPNFICPHCFGLVTAPLDSEPTTCSFSESEYTTVVLYESLDPFLETITLRTLAEHRASWQYELNQWKGMRGHIASNRRFYAKDWLRRIDRVIALKQELDSSID